MTFDCRVVRPCDVCGGEDFERLATVRSARIPPLAIPVAICRGCGFVTQSPRLGPADYRTVNKLWFAQMFVGATPTAEDGSDNRRKWEEMWRRIAPHYPQGPTSVLDVGSGRGWAIEALQQMFPGLRATAIEQWGPCQDYIRDRLGAEVVDIDLADPWPETLRNRFDLVVFRHTVEHMEEPQRVLADIAAALDERGHCYLVAPNSMRIAAGTAMTTDYLRPVHLHYFSKATLEALAWRAGLTAAVIDDASEEVWGLFRRRRDGDPAPPRPDTYQAQRAYLTARIGEAATTDRRRTLKILARRLLPDKLLRLRRGLGD